jgi:hypothetical protein
MCELYEPEVLKDEDFSLSRETRSDGSVRITATSKRVKGTEFDIRTWNLETPQRRSGSNALSRSQNTVTWRAKVIDRSKPWVAVVFAGKGTSRRKELLGTVAGR